MYKICFVDDELTSFDLCEDINYLSGSFFLELSLYLGRDLTVLDPSGDLVATCFDGVFSWC